MRAHRMSMPAPNERLIVALDVESVEAADAIVRELGDEVVFYKVGWQLFLHSHFSFVRRLADRGKRVFLDLKMEDIPETIRLALRTAAADLAPVEFMTIKGSSQIVRAALEGVADMARRPKFLMLTVLSSQADEDLQEVLSAGATVDDVVLLRARNALAVGCDGLIASGDSVAMLRRELGRDFLIVTPGIRPGGSGADDHKRTLTPARAIREGSDYVVVGRPITRAPDRRKAALDVIRELEAAAP